MRFVINGNPVTKKNSQQIVYNPKTKRPFIMPSAKYKEYAKGAIISILEQGVKYSTDFDYPIDVPVNVACHYYMATKRKVDLCNLIEATLDILCDAGVLDDDNCTIVARHDESEVRYDKNHPRVEIEITPIVGEEEWPYL